MEEHNSHALSSRRGRSQPPADHLHKHGKVRDRIQDRVVMEANGGYDGETGTFVPFMRKKRSADYGARIFQGNTKELQAVMKPDSQAQAEQPPRGRTPRKNDAFSNSEGETIFGCIQPVDHKPSRGRPYRSRSAIISSAPDMLKFGASSEGNGSLPTSAKSGKRILCPYGTAPHQSDRDARPQSKAHVRSSLADDHHDILHWAAADRNRSEKRPVPVPIVQIESTRAASRPDPNGYLSNREKAAISRAETVAGGDRFIADMERVRKLRAKRDEVRNVSVQGREVDLHAALTTESRSELRGRRMGYAYSSSADSDPIVGRRRPVPVPNVFPRKTGPRSFGYPAHHHVNNDILTHHAFEPMGASTAPASQEPRGLRRSRSAHV